jgi:hypothetical protein
MRRRRGRQPECIRLGCGARRTPSPSLSSTSGRGWACFARGVVAVHFTAPPEVARGDWFPAYTPDQAGLVVYFTSGRWLTCWTRLAGARDEGDAESRREGRAGAANGVNGVGEFHGSSPAPGSNLEGRWKANPTSTSRSCAARRSGLRDRSANARTGRARAPRARCKRPQNQRRQHGSAESARKSTSRSECREFFQPIRASPVGTCACGRRRAQPGNVGGRIQSVTLPRPARLPAAAAGRR